VEPPQIVQTSRSSQLSSARSLSQRSFDELYLIIDKIREDLRAQRRLSNASSSSGPFYHWCQEKLLVVSKILMKIQEAVGRSKDTPEPKLINLLKDVK
jgi:hypothetical protein